MTTGEDALIGVSVGSYRIERLIGAGGMGRVYEARHPDMGALVAVKVLAPQASTAPDLVERFFSEARAVNLIRHERIVNILDSGRLPGGQPFIVMERLEGAPLSRILRVGGPAPLGSLGRLIGEVLEGLAAAHGHQVVHRDLKPDNIFVTRSGHAKLLDFGIAKLSPDFHGRAAETHASMLLGAPPYISPEHASGDPTGPKSDLYSLGIVLYEASTGRRPFDSGGLFEILRQHIEDQPPPPSLARPDMPAAFEQVILTALAKHPDHRYQDASAMGQALAEAIGDLPPEAFAPFSVAEAAALPAVSRELPAASKQPTAATIPGRRRSAPPPVHGAAPSSWPPADAPPSPPAIRPAPDSRRLVIAGALAILLVGGGATLFALSRGPASSTASGETGSDTGNQATDAASPSLLAVQDAATRSTDAMARSTAALARSTDAAAAQPSPPDAGPRVSASRVDAAAGPAGGTDSDPAAKGGPSSIKTPRPAQFDVTQFYPAVRRLARKLAADADLSLIRAAGVGVDGLVDLRKGTEVTYFFVSPSRRQAGDEWCMVVVTVNAQTATASQGRTSDGCKNERAVQPRCSLQSIMEQASQAGAPADASYLVHFLGDWGVSGGGFGQKFPDSCK